VTCYNNNRLPEDIISTDAVRNSAFSSSLNKCIIHANNVHKLNLNS